MQKYMYVGMYIPIYAHNNSENRSHEFGRGEVWYKGGFRGRKGKGEMLQLIISKLKVLIIKL